MASNLDAAKLFRVDGMVAVVTGGGTGQCPRPNSAGAISTRHRPPYILLTPVTGIGLVMARTLATNGAKKVYILGRRKEVLDSAASEFPGVLVPIQCDVTSQASLQAAVDVIAADAGYVNLLVANSGIMGPRTTWNPDLSVSEVRAQMFDQAVMEQMTQTMHVNVTGAFFTMVAFLELLDAGNKMALKGGFGAPIKDGSDVPSIQSQVIVISSIAAFSRMRMSSPSYAASKAAILHLTKHASSNLAKYGIRANALAPGRKRHSPSPDPSNSV